MTYDLQTLLLIEVDTMAVLVSLVCGVLMWRNRREVPDRSRIILFLITLTALPIIGKVISLMTHGLNNRFVEVLPIVPTIMDGETTAIHSIDNGQLTMDNGATYDLQGRRVAQPTKGLYIVNGRKVVVK